MLSCKKTLIAEQNGTMTLFGSDICRKFPYAGAKGDAHAA